MLHMLAIQNTNSGELVTAFQQVQLLGVLKSTNEGYEMRS